MKKMFLLLLVSIIVPAWAAETVAPAPVAQTAVTIQFSGSAKSVQVLLAEMEKDAVYKDAGCSGKPMKKSAKMAKLSCSNASGALLDYLLKNTPIKVRWSISSVITLVMLPACTLQTCSGARACFQPRCGAACSPC